MKHQLGFSVIGLLIALCAIWSPAGLTDDRDDWDDRDHWDNGHDSDGRHRMDDRATGLVEEVRDVTRRFRDVSMAMAEGYGLFLGCVSGPQEGAMGVHFANGTLVNDDVVDAERPEVLVYEPRRNGRFKLVAVEFLVIAEAWNASHTTPPVLSGQTFHFTGEPNRYGLPAFYALHVWAWEKNPHGTFVNWNPRVSCEDYAPESP